MSTQAPDPDAKMSNQTRVGLLVAAGFFGVFSALSIFAGLTSEDRLVSALCIGPGIIVAAFALFMVAAVIQDHRFPAENSPPDQPQETSGQ